MSSLKAIGNLSDYHGPSGPTELFVIEVQEPPVEKVNGTWLVMETTGHFMKLARAVPTARKTSSYFASLFMDFFALPFGILEYVLTDIRNPFLN